MNHEVLAELRATALHEAGHAVVSVLVGCRIHRVQIDADASAFHLAADGAEFGRIQYMPGQRLSPKRQVFIFLAGHAAVMLDEGRASDPPLIERIVEDGATDDFIAAMKLIGSILPDRLRGVDEDDNIGLAIGYCWGEVLRLLDDHWGAVEDVAEALIQRQSLDGAEVADIIQRSRRQASAAIGS